MRRVMRRVMRRWRGRVSTGQGCGVRGGPQWEGAGREFCTGASDNISLQITLLNII